MTLPEVFKVEGLDERTAGTVVFTECVGGRKPVQLHGSTMDWTKATDGCWYAEGWRFIPAIAGLGDLQGAFDFVGRNGPATPF